MHSANLNGNDIGNYLPLTEENWLAHLSTKQNQLESKNPPIRISKYLALSLLRLEALRFGAKVSEIRLYESVQGLTSADVLERLYNQTQSMKGKEWSLAPETQSLRLKSDKPSLGCQLAEGLWPKSKPVPKWIEEIVGPRPDYLGVP